MKYSIKYTSAFKQSRKLMQKRGENLEELDEIISKLANGISLSYKHHDHELSGKMKGFRECHIKPDWLLIYSIEHDLLILTLVDTGSHSDMFGM